MEKDVEKIIDMVKVIEKYNLLTKRECKAYNYKKCKNRDCYKCDYEKAISKEQKQLIDVAN